MHRFEVLVLVAFQCSIFFCIQNLYTVYQALDWSDFKIDIETVRSLNDQNETDRMMKDLPYYSPQMQLDLKGSVKFMAFAQFVGVFAGCFLGGILSDRFGRNWTTQRFLFVGGLILIGCGFISDKIGIASLLYVLSRVLVGVCSGIVIVSSWSLTTEMVQPKTRFIARSFSNWPNARLFLALVCFLTKYWQYSMFAFGGTAIVTAIIYWRLLPESPIWLHSKSRFIEYELAVLSIRDFNKQPYDLNIPKEIRPPVSILEVFRLPELRITCFVLIILWFSTAFGAYGLDLGHSQFLGGIFITQFVMAGLLILTRVSLGILELKTGWIRRRNLQIISLSASAMMLALSAVMIATGKDKDLSTLFKIVFTIGFVFFELTWDVCYLCVTEQVPTDLRATVLGACSVFGRLGMVSSTILAQLGAKWPPIITVVVASICLLNLILSYLLLRESKEAVLAQVLDNEIKEETAERERRKSSVKPMDGTDGKRRRSSQKPMDDGKRISVYSVPVA